MSESTELYGGRAIVTFNPVRHTYRVSVPSRDFKEYQPSVTSVLRMKDKSGPLVKWAVRCALDYVRQEAADGILLDCVLDDAADASEKQKVEAAEIGTLVHRSLEQHLKSLAGQGPSPTLPLVPDHTLAPHLTPEMLEQANKAVKAGLDYFNQHKIEPLAIEQPRWSAMYGYIGTCDLIANVDGVPSVLDYKTGKKLYPEVFLQLAAYQKAYEEEYGTKLQRRIAVNVTRDGELVTKERDNETLERDFLTFRALLNVWRWHKENDDYYGPPKPAPRVLGPLN